MGGATDVLVLKNAAIPKPAMENSGDHTQRFIAAQCIFDRVYAGQNGTGFSFTTR